VDALERRLAGLPARDLRTLARAAELMETVAVRGD
jgi:hypothetical protein